MAGITIEPTLPVPDKTLRDLAKNVARTLPDFSEKAPATGVKELQAILAPVLDTADLPELENSHRAAASNALCAIVEHCGASDTEYAREAILDDSIWTRIFNIYLQRSGDAKGKSMRQLLLALTGIIIKNQSPRADELRKRATASFLDIICEREDRVKVKPALQGLAHFLLRDVVSIAELVELFDDLLKRSSDGVPEPVTSQTVFKAFLAWAVHHDTSLSAGHLIKNFLIQARRIPDYNRQTDSDIILPLWIEPMVQALHDWPDRIQEIRTNVFPQCFLPNISEYTQFLAYLHFDVHVSHKGTLPEEFQSPGEVTSLLEDAEEFRILLAAIATGKELTIVKDSDHRTHPNIEIRDGAVYLPDDISGTWMSNSEPEVRLAGMFLSVYSTSVTKAFNGGVLQALKRNLVHLHTDTDANFRREVHGYTQKLFDRLRASTATLAKTKAKSSTSGQARLAFPKASSQRDPLTESLAFVVWYIRFLEGEIRPTASYQSRVTALRCFIIVLRSGIDPGVPFAHLSKSAQGQLNWAHGLQIGNLKLVRSLLDLVLDPFDDVRDAAVSVLQLCLIALPQTEKEHVLSMIPRFIARAESIMLRTGRADQADGVARAYGMIFTLTGDEPMDSANDQFSSKLRLFDHLKTQLGDTLDLASRDLSQAVDGRPVHGTFAALRYVVDQADFYSLVATASEERFATWKQLHGDVTASIENLWSCVYHVLCADAPEGHVPDELEDEASLDTKEILSYSWRGLKEASVLLRTIISKAPIGDGERDLITPEFFAKLGRLCFTQLLELRHRGAFSTVSQTFASFCRRCVTSNVPALRALPELWYQETLRSIQAKADAITRRSAGIPAAMSALLAAEPQPGGKLFPRAMRDLVAETLVEAKSANIEESRLPQVHALNCIKEIFTTSKLSVASEAFIGQGLELAAKTLSSSIWPLRNCSLMLFKALIERLLGSDEAQDWKERERAKTSRFSYDNYPSLVQILIDLLEPEGPLKMMVENASDGGSPLDLHGAEGVFPALQILRQARPPGDISRIQALVTRLFPSPHWHLRDMAARTYVSLRTTSELYGDVSKLLDGPLGSHNEQHGKLLAVKFSLRKIMRDATRFTSENFARVIQNLSELADRWYVPSNCPFVRSAFLDIVSFCGMTMLHRTDTSEVQQAWQKLTSAVSIGPEHSIGPSDHYGDDLLQTSLAQAFFVDRVILRDDSLGIMVSDEYQNIGDALMLLASEDPDTCCTALDTLDSILQLESSKSSTIPLSLVLAHIHRVILKATDPEVISKAQAVLADALTNNDLKEDFFSLTTSDQIISTLTKLENQCLTAPPSNMQSALHLLGFFLDVAYTTYPSSDPSIPKAIARYIRLLRMTIIDTNPFDTRFAAVQSLSALTHIFTASPTAKTTGPLILGLSLVLYDLVNDDDDEIRTLAARTTTTLLRAQGHTKITDTVPILTAYRLATFLATSFRTSGDLAKESLRRLMNTTALFNEPFTQTLENVRTEDTSLFAQEKQNLYKDDMLDAILWSRVLLSLTPSCVSVKMHRGLKEWVIHALDVLQNTSVTEDDGALGWTSKAEVFTLGVRVFCASEVVMRWGGETRSEVLIALAGLEGAGVHGLWKDRMSRVVEKEVLGSLRRVQESLMMSL